VTDQEILAGLAEIVDEIAGVPADEVTPDKNFVEDLDIRTNSASRSRTSSSRTSRPSRTSSTS